MFHLKRKPSTPKRLTAFILVLTFTVTGAIQDMTGFSIKSLFAATPSSETGSIGNLRESTGILKPFQTDLFTGRAQANISIFTPPGRKGISPQVSLSYSSSSGNSWVGMGWALDVGFIQRSTRNGVPTYIDSQDIFTFSINGVTSDLVKISATEYHAKDESGEFLKFIYQGNYWTVFDKSGTQYIFGQNPQAEQTNTKGIFSWFLEKTEDVLGNTITYSYTQDSGNLYLTHIDYNGNEIQNFSPTHSVEFILDDRPDPTFSYISGGRVDVKKRLKTINVKVQNQLSRTYNLTYEQSLTVGRSRLKQVQECGTDGTTCLPPTTFTYQDTNLTFSTTPYNWPITIINGWTNFRTIRQWSAEGTNADVLDINGDGLPDQLYTNPNAEFNDLHVFYNTGQGFSTQDTPLTNLPKTGTYAYIHENISNYDSGADFIDLNGDGLLDRVVKDPNSNNWNVYFNRGGVLDTVPTPWPITIPDNWLSFRTLRYWSAEGTALHVLDVNGDGLPDRLFTNPNTEYNDIHLFYNTGTGFSSQETTVLYSVPKYGTYAYINSNVSHSDTDADFIDLNGDGLPDRVVKDPNSDRWLVYWNTGSGLESQPTYWSLPTSPDFPADQFRTIRKWAAEGTSLDIFDVNGDGLPDRILTWTGGPASEYQANRIYLNTGSGFAAQPIIYQNVPKVGTYAYIHENDSTWTTGSDYIDINGDSLPDRVVKDPSNNQWLVYFNQSPIPDLLKSVDNGRGSVTTIEYKPSTQFDNRDTNGIYRLSFPVQVVTKTTTTDGMGNSYVTQYSYRGGMYDATSREFRGFRETTVTDARGTQTIQTFGQDDHLKGKTLKTEVRDSSGNLFSKQENTWSSSAPYTGVNFVFLSQSDSYLYDGDSTFKQTRKRFAYDSTNGNILTVYDDGDPNVTTDDKRTENQYVMNATDYILNTISKVSTYDNQNNLVSEKYFYYDSQTDITAPPIKGLLTKQQDLIKSSPLTLASTQMTYDDFGNVLTIQDALNRVTTNQYDTTFNLYLVKVTNALNQTQEFTYDPLIAQIAQTKDQNAQITQTVYDVLGRPVKIISPLDSASSSTKAVFYDDTTFPNRVVTHIKTDVNAPSLTLDDNTHTGYLTSYSFVDGLGREIERRSPAEDSGNQIVSGVVTFDNRGQAHEQYAPYTSSIQKFYTPDYAGIPKATFTYDAVGRRTRVDFPDSTYSTIQYDDYVKTVQDANGHQKKYTQDAFGNLIKVEELNQGATYTTQYQYDALNRLAKTIDHTGLQTQMIYDMIGRKTEMIDPNMGHWIYTYDTNGNLLTQKDARNVTLSFAYDELNRLMTKTYPDNSHIDYTYDSCPSATCGGLLGENYPIGKLLKVVDVSGVQTFRYDKLGRVLEDKKSLDDGHNYDFVRAYDAGGRIIGLQYPDGETLGIIYNGMGEVETMYVSDILQNTQTIVSSVDYNASGQITKITYGNGAISDYTYNPQTLRLQHLVTKDSAQTPIQDLSYQFDNVGNVKSMTDAINTNTQSFLYDDLDRLKQATGTYGMQTYAYDAIGNMTQKETATLTYGNSSHPHAVTRYQTSTQTIDYQYDANGNMTQRNFSDTSYDSLGFDFDNRLFNVTHHEITGDGGCSCDGGTDTQTQIATFQYDASGARVKKVSGSNTTYYLGKDYEVDYGSSPKTRKAFFLGDTRIAEKEISSGGITHFRWFHGDHLGSTNVVTNESGVKTLLMEYLPYGEVKIRAGSDLVKNTFTGQKEDLESGLMYYNARYYDTKLGRFISADPTVQRPTDPQDLNRYAYCRNNPIRFTDPSGLKWKWSWKGFFAFGVVGGLIGATQAGAIIGTTLAIAAAPFSGGQSLWAIAALAAVGAAGGAIGGGIGSAIDGNGFGSGAASGAIMGAVMGATAGLTGGGANGSSDVSKISGITNNAEGKLAGFNLTGVAQTVSVTSTKATEVFKSILTIPLAYADVTGSLSPAINISSKKGYDSMSASRSQQEDAPRPYRYANLSKVDGINIVNIDNSNPLSLDEAATILEMNIKSYNIWAPTQELAGNLASALSLNQNPFGPEEHSIDPRTKQRRSGIYYWHYHWRDLAGNRSKSHVFYGPPH